jgi:hypothetical protein
MLPKSLEEIKAQAMGGVNGVAQGEKQCVFMRDYYNILAPVLRNSVGAAQAFIEPTNNPEAMDLLEKIRHVLLAMLHKQDPRTTTGLAYIYQLVEDTGDVGEFVWGVLSSQILLGLLSVPALFPEFGITLPDDQDNVTTQRTMAITALLAGLPQDLRRQVLTEAMEIGELSNKVDYAYLRIAEETTRREMEEFSNMVKGRRNADNNQSN